MVRRIGRRAWETLAKDNAIPVGYVLENVAQVLHQLPSAVEGSRSESDRGGTECKNHRSAHHWDPATRKDLHGDARQDARGFAGRVTAGLGVVLR